VTEGATRRTPGQHSTLPAQPRDEAPVRARPHAHRRAVSGAPRYSTTSSR